MALVRIVTVVGLLLSLVKAATVPVDQTLMFKEIDSLLRRCPCVPINTCYSQGVNLNEQTFLNVNFHCPDHTNSHCCGPYFPTLGSEDFYFDEGFSHKNESRRSATNIDDKTMIVMAQNTTTEKTEPVTKLVLVYPETTTTTTEIPEETTTEFTTLEPTSTETEPTTTDVETTTEPVTTTTIPSTTELTTLPITTSKTKLSLQAQRTARLQNRPPFLKPDLQTLRTTKASRTSTTTSTTTTTTLSPTARRFPTRKALSDSDFHRRFLMSRLRMLARSSTTTSTRRPRPIQMPRPMHMPRPRPAPVVYYDDDYDDEDYSYED